jgi:tRNA(adenine34) deaminase
MYTKIEDEQFMQQALDLAKQASLLGEVPVAAIIVKNGNIIAKAHNRRELDKNPIAHAEVLAIQQASKVLGDWRLEECTLYVTLEPCSMCAGAMWLARIKRCVYGCTDPKSGFLGSLYNLSETKQLNHHYEVQGGVLADECAELLQQFFRKIRQRKKTPLD